MTRTFILISLLLALPSCGAKETPDAAPGTVERTTDALDRNEAALQRSTIRRIDREAEARDRASKGRIRAIEREREGRD